MTGGRGPVGRIVAELRRRHVFRTLALYIVGAWGLMQVADVLLPALALPESAIRYLLLATIAAFPVALVFAWFFDVTTSGISRTAPADPVAVEIEPLKAVDYVLLSALLLVLALTGYGLSDLVLERSPGAGAEAPETVVAAAAGAPMVGVLPFAHLGSSEDGDFFASGIHDDLLTRLAKLKGLRVVSRTSVLGYANTTKKIPEIGRELRADAILEGGIRIAGDQLRINAQLIDARSDEHLWAETYDRRLTASNIFEIQTEIALAIAASLQAALTPEESSELAKVPTDNMAAYRAFHETMQWSYTANMHSERDRQRFQEGMRRAFELDPQFTRPMVELVAHLALRVHDERGDELLAEIEALVERIGELAPDSADHYAAQGLYFYYVIKDYDRAEALVRAALERAPSDTRLLQIRSWINRRQGDFESYLQAARQARELDPGSQRLNAVYIHRLILLHRYTEADAELRALVDPHESDRFNRALLDLRHHHDPARYAAALAGILGPLDDVRQVRVLHGFWEAQLAARDFAGAQRTVDRVAAIMAPEAAEAELPVRLMPNDLWLQLLQARLTEDRDRVATLVAEIKRVMGLTGRAPGDVPSYLHPLDKAEIALATGDPDTAIAAADGYWQDPGLDRAEWLGRRGACQLLAMARAAGDAVACLRDALTPPSDAHPFLEPLMPAYDPIRETPAFRALAAELREEGWLAAP